MSVLDRAEQLKNELDSMRPLDGEREARIMQKFRLDWNYHSNNLEGNSLTYGETKALLLFDKAIGNKDFKDYDEMRNHNFVVRFIEESSKDSTELSEKFIREIHLLLLKTPRYKKAQTPDGEPTTRKIEVGKYKTVPNHVITATGEPFYFAPPDETPARMHDLIEWFREEREKADANPVILAALFHYRFIRIHPFDDGNGRTSRILMNFILMQFGYPPVIIKTEDKENYYAVLRLADADELEPLIEYIAQNLSHSLEMIIESLKESDDFNKQLAILEKTINAKFNIKSIGRTKESLLAIFENVVIPLAVRFYEIGKKFEVFYKNAKFEIRILSFAKTDTQATHKFNETNLEDMVNFVDSFTEEVDLIYFYSSPQSVISQYESRIKFKFGYNKYWVKNLSLDSLEKNYSEILSSLEMDNLVKTLADKHKKSLEDFAKIEIPRR